MNDDDPRNRRDAHRLTPATAYQGHPNAINAARPTVAERLPSSSQPTIVHAVPAMPQEHSPHVDPFIGLEVGDGYAIVSKLAEGGMGALYIAAHRDSPNRRWAIKVLLPELIDRLAPPSRQDIWNRFQVEAKIALRIEHPHVIDVVGWGQLANGSTYIKMELLRGANLRRWAADRHGSFVPVDDVIRVMAQVCAALEQAHQMGVVHRDLKPENIFVCDRDDGSVFIKLLDFGIARVMAPEHVPGGRHTTVPKAMGTPGYWSPEQQFDPASVDARADIYALGVIVYELLTAQLPSIGSLAPANTPPQVPQAWYQPLAQALAHDVNRRPATARAFLSSLVENTPYGAAIAESACPLLYGRVSGHGNAQRSGSFPPNVTPPPLGPSTLSNAAGAYGTGSSAPRRGRTVAIVSIAAIACSLVVGVGIVVSRGARTSASTPSTMPAAAPPHDASDSASTVLAPAIGANPSESAVGSSVAPTPNADASTSYNASTSDSAPQPPSGVAAEALPATTAIAVPPATAPSTKPSTKKKRVPKEPASKETAPRTNSEQRLPTSLDGVGD